LLSLQNYQAKIVVKRLAQERKNVWWRWECS